MRVVAVHAHPDDESIATGGTLAQLAAQGADVTVVTCTLGEEGEVIGDKYAHLIADEADQLGGYRISELYEALDILGVKGRFLGGAGAFRDSGMVGSPAHAHPRSFVSQTEKAIAALNEVIDEIQPDLVITYGSDGGYGHPDHIQAHRITHALEHKIPRIWWAVADRQELEEARVALPGVKQGWRAAQNGELPGVDKHDVRIELSDHAYERKRQAMAAHATQVTVDGEAFALSNNIQQPLMRVEHYQVGHGDEHLPD